VRAIDTNILARFYLRDDAAQGRIAAGVLAAGDVFVPKTVVLELEWVLRYVADQPQNKVIECLEHLIALPGVTVEDRDEIEAALAHSRNGIDFADAMHLATSKSCSELLTFDDRGYARRAKKLRLKPPVRVPNR
jgi:predicted nucleic-acid-binding protein